jgi:Skp family chaperone for outer membrane proteins
VTGTRGMFARPTSVAVVNLPVVLEGLEQRAVAEAELTRMAEEIEAENQRWRDEVAGIDAQLEELPETDVAQRDALRDRGLRKVLEYEEWRRYETDRLDLEKSLLMRDLYQKVHKAIRDLAEVEGFDLVLTDDTLDDIGVMPDSPMTRENQVRQQIRSLRTLFASPVVDLTDQLIERMNNEFSSGQ